MHENCLFLEWQLPASKKLMWGLCHCPSWTPPWGRGQDRWLATVKSCIIFIALLLFSNCAYDFAFQQFCFSATMLIAFSSYVLFFFDTCVLPFPILFHHVPASRDVHAWYISVCSACPMHELCTIHSLTLHEVCYHLYCHDMPWHMAQSEHNWTMLYAKHVQCIGLCHVR